MMIRENFKQEDTVRRKVSRHGTGAEPFVVVKTPFDKEGRAKGRYYLFNHRRKLSASWRSRRYSNERNKTV